MAHGYNLTRRTITLLSERGQFDKGIRMSYLARVTSVMAQLRDIERTPVHPYN